MKRSRVPLLLLLAGLGPAASRAEEAKRAAPAVAPAAAEVGKPAPDFALKDLDGKTYKLSEFAGKTVVLEWFNPECPFVRYAHTKGPLKDMGNEQAKKGVIWLAVNSSSAGKQGHGIEKNQGYRKEYAMAYPILVDETGEVGRRYGAKTTPHVFVIDGKGTLAYAGALDSAPLGEVEGGGAPVNYVEAALADLAAGRPVARAESRPYGCSVKYAMP